MLTTFPMVNLWLSNLTRSTIRRSQASRLMSSRSQKNRPSQLLKNQSRVSQKWLLPRCHLRKHKNRPWNPSLNRLCQKLTLNR